MSSNCSNSIQAGKPEQCKIRLATEYLPDGLHPPLKLPISISHVPDDIIWLQHKSFRRSIPSRGMPYRPYGHWKGNRISVIFAASKQNIRAVSSFCFRKGVLSLVYLQRPACGEPLQLILTIHNRAYLLHSTHRPREELFVCCPSMFHFEFNGSCAQCGMKALLFRCLTPYRLASPTDNGTFCFVPVWFLCCLLLTSVIKNRSKYTSLSLVSVPNLLPLSFNMNVECAQDHLVTNVKSVINWRTHVYQSITFLIFIFFTFNIP